MPHWISFLFLYNAHEYPILPMNVYCEYINVNVPVLYLCATDFIARLVCYSVPLGELKDKRKKISMKDVVFISI